MQGLELRCADAQRAVAALLAVPGAVLVGHALHHDLHALRIDFQPIIDTSFLFSYKCGPICARAFPHSQVYALRHGLRTLLKFLGSTNGRGLAQCIMAPANLSIAFSVGANATWVIAILHVRVAPQREASTQGFSGVHARAGGPVPDRARMRAARGRRAARLRGGRGRGHGACAAPARSRLPDAAAAPHKGPHFAVELRI